MPKVLIAPAPLADLQGAFLDTLCSAGFEPVYPLRKAQMTEADLLERLQGVEASLAGSEPYSPRVLAAHPQLRVIARAGVGYDAVDLPAANAGGIAVTIAPNTNQDAVAEHTFALMLALAKRLIPQHMGTVAGKWPRQANLPLRGRTLGIAGLGRIGKAVALRGACFGMKLVAHEPYPDQEFVARHAITLMDMDGLFRESDYLSLHLPLFANSRQVVNARSLGLMKPTAFLINTARGGLVHEPDLLAALKEGKIAGAGLDVFEEEPPPADHPLLHLDNVVVTPHAAGVDLQSRDDMALSAARAIVDLHQGKWPEEKVVNPEVRSAFQWSK